MTAEKPPYRVPSMAEIAALPPNGLKVVSTFSGCGGSCLGYRMAGYRVLWANEFIPAAAETYRANHPETILDTQDMRKIQPGDILDTIGMKVGEFDVVEGSPPCASFSTAGKREKHWGTARKYSDTVQRVDDLFFEYARLVAGLQPRVFVAENVSGLVKGVAKGYFLEILGKLKDCGYRVACRVLDSQWLGVPQARRRTIFIGVREALGKDPVFPKPLPYRYSLRDALPWVTRGKYGPAWREPDSPSPTVSAHGSYNPATSHQGLELVEVDMSRFAIAKEWDRLKPGQASDKYFNLVRPDPDEPCPTICASHGHPGIASVTHRTLRGGRDRACAKRSCRVISGLPVLWQ